MKLNRVKARKTQNYVLTETLKDILKYYSKSEILNVLETMKEVK